MTKQHKNLKAFKYTHRYSLDYTCTPTQWIIVIQVNCFCKYFDNNSLVYFSNWFRIFLQLTRIAKNSLTCSFWNERTFFSSCQVLAVLVYRVLFKATVKTYYTQQKIDNSNNASNNCIYSRQWSLTLSLQR